MATTKAEYFIDEMTDWKRTITFHMDEIYGLTGRLAEVIHRNSIPNIAVKVEKHQHELNVISDRFHRLQLQVRRQEASLKTDATLIDDSQIKTETEDFQNDLRHKLHDVEKKFIDAKNDCQSFLAGIYNK
jgi:hypothetical protein